MNFDCAVCKCKLPKKIKRVMENDFKEIETDKIIVINNFAFDTRTIMRACDNCGTAKIDMETISTSSDSTEVEKQKVIEIKNKLQNVGGK